MADFVKGYNAQQNGYLSIKTDIDEVLGYFDGVDANKKQIAKICFKRVGNRSASYAKKNYGSVLRKRSGKLKNSIKSHYYDDHVYQWIEVFPDANTGKATGLHSGKTGGFRYGWALGAGYTVIATKDHPTVHGKKTILRFQIDGKWKSFHSIKVEARDFVEGPVTRYVASPACKNELTKVLDQQMDYWTKRYEGKK